MATTLLTNNTCSSTSNTTFPPTSPSHEETLTLLVAGISTPLLVVALAVVIITIIATIIWTKGRKSTENVHNQDTEQQLEDRPYATLTRQEYPDITSNHPMEVLYAVVDMPEKSQGEEAGQLMKQDEKNVENLPNDSVEEKSGVALEVMYAVVNKQEKKKQRGDTPPAQSNTVDGVYCNTAAIRKEKAAEYEEVAPQIPPHTVEKLYTAVVKKPMGGTTPTEKTPL